MENLLAHLSRLTVEYEEGGRAKGTVLLGYNQGRGGS